MKVVTQGAKNGLCSVVFAVLYFFGMAASICSWYLC